MRLVFLDFDGVVNNRGCWGKGKPSVADRVDPKCIAELNRIIQATRARIVVSSSWRGKFVAPMSRLLKQWGVAGKVIGVTPRLERKQDGGVYVAQPRGLEIQRWLDEHGPAVQSFVILDDDADMEHLTDRLVQTSFETGLTTGDAERAIKMLVEQNGLTATSL